MGYYIEPPNCTKEQWLREHAIYLVPPGPDAWSTLQKFQDTHPGMLPVCLVQNPYFTAAGICFSQRELEAFMVPADSRRKTWYAASIERLKEVCPELLRVCP